MAGSEKCAPLLLHNLWWVFKVAMVGDLSRLPLICDHL